MRLVLLLAVLIQCTPVGVCVIELKVLGTDCHEWSVPVILGDGHGGGYGCGAGSGGQEPQCICEQPKVVGASQTVDPPSATGWADLSAVLSPIVVPAPTAARHRPLADRLPNLLAARRLPLLI